VPGALKLARYDLSKKRYKSYAITGVKGLKDFTYDAKRAVYYITDGSQVGVGIFGSLPFSLFDDRCNFKTD